MESCPPPSMARIFSLRVSAMIGSIGDTYELTVETLSSAVQSTIVVRLTIVFVPFFFPDRQDSAVVFPGPTNVMTFCKCN
jgi:hypothetical protein